MFKVAFTYLLAVGMVWTVYLHYKTYTGLLARQKRIHLLPQAGLPTQHLCYILWAGRYDSHALAENIASGLTVLLAIAAVLVATPRAAKEDTQNKME